MAQNYRTAKGGYAGWIIIILIIAIIITTIFVGRFFKREESIKLSFKNGETLSFFIAASDEDMNIKGAAVIFFNTKTNRCAVVSILIKTYINFYKHGYFTLEEALKKKLSYIDILDGINGLIGSKINYYVFINKENFIRLIDMIGGVEITTESIKHPTIKVNIPKGPTLLDGDKSIEYLSFILDEQESSEYDQLKRIQNYIRGFLKLKPDFLEQFNNKIVKNYLFTTITTNMSLNELLIFYDEVKKKYKNNIRDYSIGLNNITLYCDKKDQVGYEYVYLPKQSGVWINSQVKDALLKIEKVYTQSEIGTVVLEVLNGTKTIGMAGRTAEYLSSYGFDILNVENAESDDYENTVLIVYGDEQKVRRLSELIRCKNVIIKENTDNNKIDATLIIGNDFDGKIVR